MSQPAYTASRDDRAEEVRSNTKIWMVITQVVAGLCLLPWCFLAGFASMIGWPMVAVQEG